jgi:hypothetical protein
LHEEYSCCSNKKQTNNTNWTKKALVGHCRTLQVARQRERISRRAAERAERNRQTHLSPQQPTRRRLVVVVVLLLLLLLVVVEVQVADAVGRCRRRHRTAPPRRRQRRAQQRAVLRRRRHRTLLVRRIAAARFVRVAVRAALLPLRREDGTADMIGVICICGRRRFCWFFERCCFE